MKRLRRFFSIWQNWVSFLLLLTYVAIAIAAPYISPDDSERPGPFRVVGKGYDAQPHPPSEKAVLGMLPYGLDVYHPLIWGARDALAFGLIVTVTTALFGVIYGAVSGFVGNRPGNLMIRIADSFLAFPPLAGVVLLQQLFSTTMAALAGLYFTSEYYGETIEIPQVGPATTIQFLLEHINPLMLSLIILSWMPYARLVHTIVLTLKQTEFVQAAWALGGSPFWIIRKHILRHSTSAAMVLAARDVGGVVVLQATLTFVGMGGESIWGQMLAQGRNWVIGPGGSLFRYWWVFLPPTLAVILFGVAWNMFGDGLNDLLEPAARQSFGGRRSLGRGRRKRIPAQSRLEQGLSPSGLSVQSQRLPPR